MLQVCRKTSNCILLAHCLISGEVRDTKEEERIRPGHSFYLFSLFQTLTSENRLTVDQYKFSRTSRYCPINKLDLAEYIWLAGHSFCLYLLFFKNWKHMKKDDLAELSVSSFVYGWEVVERADESIYSDADNKQIYQIFSDIQTHHRSNNLPSCSKALCTIQTMHIRTYTWSSFGVDILSYNVYNVIRQHDFHIQECALRYKCWEPAGTERNIC